MAETIDAEHDDQFPTHETLRQANVKVGRPISLRDGTERSVPRPAAQNKNKIFALNDFKHIDERACQVLLLSSSLLLLLLLLLL